MTTRPPVQGLSAILNRLVWPSLKIASVVALVVIPFGYAITGIHHDVWMGVGCGVAIGVGVGVRGGSRSGPWTGILIGSIVGVATSLIAGALSQNAGLILTPPILALAVGLIDGLGRSSLSGYRDVSRETFIVSVLVCLGFLPGPGLPVQPLVLMPWLALLIGLLMHRRKGWRDVRPPRLLILGAVAVLALEVLVLVSESEGLGRQIWLLVRILLLTMVALPAAAFLLGRAAITWLGPRLRVYSQLADYLRVMWVPIGGFAVGYLTIIALFGGFYGTLERFSPGAFDGAGTGIIEWLSFSFFNALGQDYNTIVPVSVAARALVGAHLILSVGWALVLFAAVMSSIQPKLDRIARRHGDESGD